MEDNDDGDFDYEVNDVEDTDYTIEDDRDSFEEIKDNNVKNDLFDAAKSVMYYV